MNNNNLKNFRNFSIFPSPGSSEKTRIQLPGESFISGGLGCICAGFLTNPIDVAKIRLQLSGELKATQSIKRNVFSMMSEVSKSEGMRGLMKGVTASMYREGSYSTMRIGLYPFFKAKLAGRSGVETRYGKTHDPFWIRLAAGLMSGGTGSILTTPFDLVKVRMQADISLDPSKARYQSFPEGIRDIYKNEGGLSALWRGWQPNVSRAALLTAVQVSVYDSTKQQLLATPYFSDSIWTHATAATMSGFWTSLATSTVDQIKTRVMNDVMSGNPKYTGSLDCLFKTFRAEGVPGLMKGFGAQWLRIGPHSFITFLVGEKILLACGVVASWGT